MGGSAAEAGDHRSELTAKPSLAPLLDHRNQDATSHDILTSDPPSLMHLKVGTSSQSG